MISVPIPTFYELNKNNRQINILVAFRNCSEPSFYIIIEVASIKKLIKTFTYLFYVTS